MKSEIEQMAAELAAALWGSDKERAYWLMELAGFKRSSRSPRLLRLRMGKK